MTVETLYYAQTFRAMNTEIEVLIYPNATSQHSFEQKAKVATEKVMRLFEKAEASLSRFNPDSELSQLNRDGSLERTSLLLYEAICAALKMARLTLGVFDPTILEALEKAGYNRSFELLAQPGVTCANKAIFPSLNKYREVRLEPKHRTIHLPEGTRIDLGGIAKGMTVDSAVTLLRESGFKNFMISAGGDMYLSGNDIDRQSGWYVNVQNPFTLSYNLTGLQVKNCAVATSSITKRRWLRGGKLQHHLIDPRTAQPVENSLACVTVIAPTVRQADVLAKTALILGQDEGRRFIEQQAGCAGLFIRQDGSLLRTADRLDI